MVLLTGQYRHYKGGIYEVIAVARHSESLEELVIYRATYQKEGENLWARPLSMFTGKVLKDGQEVDRFKKI